MYESDAIILSFTIRVSQCKLPTLNCSLKGSRWDFYEIGRLFRPLRGVYVKRYWLMIFVFANVSLKRSLSTDLTRCLEKFKNSDLLISQIVRLQIPNLTANTVPHTHP